MNYLDWILIVGYIAAMIGLSVHLGRKQKSVEDYYLGGNQLPWWAIAISTMATQCSSNSFLGKPAFVALSATGGLLLMQSELSLPLAMIVVILLLLPFFRRAGVISVYEYLELRFGIITRTALSVLFQLSRALATGVTVYSVALVLKVALGLPLTSSIVLVGVVTIIYDTFGGMEAVVYSDVIQMAVLYGAALFVIGWSISIVGGLGPMLAFWSKGAIEVAPSLGAEGSIELASRFKVLQLETLGFAEGETYSFWACLFGYFFLLVSYYGCDQSQVQRELSSRNIDDTNLSLFFNGVTRFFLTLTMVMMGLAIGAVLFSDLARNGDFLRSVLEKPELQNQMVIHFVLDYMPHGFIGLVVVAIFAAAMSSLDSAINSLSATTMRDIYERFVDPSPAEGTRLFWSKALTVFWGVFCSIAAFATPYLGKNVVIAINKVGSLTYGPILGVFLLALLTRRASDRGSFVGLVFGVTLDLYLWVATPISWLWWNVFGCLATVAVGYLASLALPQRQGIALDGLVWSPGAYDSFGFKRNWRAYCWVLVGAFFVFLAICSAIETIPAMYAS